MGDTEVFYKNGFSAVIFSTVMERSVVGNIFRINEEKIEEELAKYTKLVSSDLLLLHLPGCIFTAIRDKSFIDFIVELRGGENDRTSGKYGNYGCAGRIYISKSDGAVWLTSHST